MSFSAACSLIAGILFAISASWYVVDVAKQKAVPNIATFLMLILVSASQLASVIAKQLWSVLPFSIVSLLAPLGVCFFSLKHKKFYLELPDKIGFIGALIGFIIWLITKNAALNLYIISVVSVIIITPLIIKSFKHPELETTLPWRINLLGSFFLLLTINSAAPIVWVVPVRQFTLSLLLNIGLSQGQLKLKRKLA